MKIDKAIQILVDKLQFRAKKGTIKQTELNLMKSVIQSIIDFKNEREEWELYKEYELGTLRNKIEKLTEFLKLTGWQEKALTDIEAVRPEFMKLYRTKKDYVQSPVQFADFMLEHSELMAQISLDLKCIECYQDALVKNKTPLVQFYEKIDPHLKDFYLIVQMNPGAPITIDLQRSLYTHYVGI